MRHRSNLQKLVKVMFCYFCLFEKQCTKVFHVAVQSPDKQVGHQYCCYDPTQCGKKYMLNCFFVQRLARRDMSVVSLNSPWSVEPNI